MFGFYGVPDRASEVMFENVRVPATNMLLGEGRGFEIAQGRLGPGRIHHCMRLIGLAERDAGEDVPSRTSNARRLRQAGFGADRHPGAHRRSRIMIEQSRLLTLNAAYMMDTVGNKVAQAEIAMIKVAVPNMACQVIDWAIQAHGGGGTSNDFGLAAPTPPRGCFASPTVPTKCTATRSPGSNCASTATPERKGNAR